MVNGNREFSIAINYAHISCKLHLGRDHRLCDNHFLYTYALSTPATNAF